MRVKLSAVNFIVALVLVLTAFASAKPVMPVLAGASNIRISQIYGGGGNTSATYKNDFIELYNPTSAPMSVAGWSVQYASAAGTTWFKTDLSGSIPANGYYLIQEAAGTGGTADLPTPDATGTIAMGATAGKLALVSNTTLLTGGCPLGGAVVDFVGFGLTANCYEGTGPTPAPSNTTSVSRKDAGCLDTDSNATDFTAGTVTPRNISTAAHLCGTSPITPTCPASIRTYQNTAIQASFSAVDSDGVVVSAAITAGSTTGISLTNVVPAVAYGGTLTGTLDVSASTAGSVTEYNIEITFSNNDTTPQTATCVVPVRVIPNNCPAPSGNPIIRIGAVQGSGDVSPYLDQKVSVRGTVTGDYQADNKLKGYFLQDQSDGSAATSDGIFVYSTTPDVLLGDTVMFQGTVAEYNGLTELKVVNPDPGTYICGVPLPVPSAVALSLPQATTESFEAYEGMLVSFAQTLTVAQNYFQGRYGQVTLSDGRMFQPNNGNGLGDTVELNARRFIVLDDGSSYSNPNPVPYYNMSQPLRAGDTVVGLTGFLDEGAIDSSTPYTLGYRLHPSVAPVFNAVNLRPDPPEVIGHDMVVAGFNLYNFFTTLNDSGNTYPNPPYDTSNEPRGANNAVEFERQVVKLVAAIRAMNADILGVVEMEKYEGGPYPPADSYLLGRINDGLPVEQQYALIADPALGFGGDFIKNTILYKPARVTAVGSPVSYNIPDPVNPTEDLFNRYPVAQSFRFVSDNQLLTVVVNHLKSKSCSGASGDELDTGQGCWNAKRVRQANALLTFVNNLSTGAGDADVLLIGDYNAYGEEDPINVFEAAGMEDMMERVPAAQRYSYVFNGEAGYLDHALGTPSLAGYVKQVLPWHINADEPPVINYDNDYNPAGYYTADEFRSADHDPIWIRLNVSDEPILLTALANQTATEDALFTLTAGANFYDADVPEFDTLTFTATGLPDWLSINSATGTLSGTPLNGDVTTGSPITITVRATDAFDQFVQDDFSLTVLNSNDKPHVAVPLLDQTATQGSVFSYTFDIASFDDIDIIYGDSLVYSASGNPTWMVFTPATRTFSGTPGAADVGGPTNVTVRATDESGAYVEDIFTITVNNINDTPVLNSALLDQTATQGMALTYAAGANFSDIDAPTYDTLTFSADGAPAWLTISSITGTLSGTPANGDVTQLSGPLTITIRATDESGLYVEDSFDLTVLNSNDPPVVATPLVDHTIVTGVLVTFSFSADSFTDPDTIYGDSLSYTATLENGDPLPTWLTFTPATRSFSGTASAAELGTLYIKVTATDTYTLAISDVFVLRVGYLNFLSVMSK